MPELFQIFRAERAVDDAMVATHRDRHAMADCDLVTVVNDRNLCDFADGENETLWRIYYSGETVDTHAAEV